MALEPQEIDDQVTERVQCELNLGHHKASGQRAECGLAVLIGDTSTSSGTTSATAAPEDQHEHLNRVV